jgi:hypothetical protein
MVQNKLVNQMGTKHKFTLEQVSEYHKCMNDPFYFINNYCQVIHPSKGKIPLKLRDYQERFIKSIHEEEKTVCLASRQIGKTTSVSGYILWYASFNVKPKTCAILANKDDTAKSILDDIKGMYEQLPDWLKQNCTEYNAHTIKFENESKIFCSATSKNGLAGESVSFLYMDEVALIDRVLANDFWKANYPTIQHGEKICLTSTPRGVGDLFHKVYTEAENGQNSFNPVRIDYWECPDYQSDEWKEEQVSVLGPVGFASEYGNKFIGSSSTLIDSQALKDLKSTNPIREEKFRGGVEKYFEEPRPEEIHIAATDIGLGSGNDYSTVTIWRVVWHSPNEDDYRKYEKLDEEPPECIIDKIVQVYSYKCNCISIPDFCDKVFTEILPTWGEPYLIVENNGIGQSFVDRMSEKYYYDNAFIEDGCPSFGVNSNTKSKTNMVNSLKKNVESEIMEVKDKDLINEMLTFVEKTKGSMGASRRFGAEDGRNDDLVVNAGWCCYMVESLWFQDAVTFMV